jgi:hypothetical protein
MSINESIAWHICVELLVNICHAPLSYTTDFRRKWLVEHQAFRIPTIELWRRIARLFHPALGTVAPNNTLHTQLQTKIAVEKDRYKIDLRTRMNRQNAHFV